MRNSLVTFVKTHSLNLIVVAAACVLIQGRLLLQPSVGIDTEVMLYNPELQYRAWESIGRNGLVLLSRLFQPGAFSLMRAGILTLVFLFLAAVLWTYLFSSFRKETGRLQVLIASLVLVCSPLLTEQFYFRLQSAEVALTMCLVAVALLLVRHFAEGGGWAFLSVAALLFGFSVSVYQSFVALFLTGAAMLYVQAVLAEEEKALRKRLLLASLAVFAAGFLLNRILTLALSADGMYAAGEIFWTSRPFGENLYDILRAYAYVYGARSMDFTPAIPLTAVLVCVIAWRFAKDRRHLRGVLFAGMFVLLFVAPFAVHLFVGGSLPARARFPVSFLYAFLAFHAARRMEEFLFTEKEEGGSARMLAGYLTALVLFGGIVHSGYVSFYLGMTDLTRYREDVAFAQELWEESASLRTQAPDAAALTYAFYGVHAAETEEVSEVIGKSVFGWDSSEEAGWRTAPRIRYLFAYLGMPYAAPEASRVKEHAPDAAAMPSFPAEGSMALRDGILFVKLSD